MEKITPDYRASFTRNYKKNSVYFENRGTINQGDLIVCRLLDSTHIETPLGQMVRGYRNKILLSALDARESTGYRVGYAPKTQLPTNKKFQLLTESGVTGICTSCPKDYAPIDVEILGRVMDETRKKINMQSLAILKPAESIISDVPSVFAVGSSTDSGKTKITCTLIDFFKQAKLSVGCLKANGTASVREWLEYKDAGADFVYDSVDFGFATTYTREHSRVVGGIKSAINALSMYKPNIIFVELGGDIIGANSDSILKDRQIQNYMNWLILAAKDAFSGFGIVTYLKQHKLKLPNVISGEVEKNELTRKRCRKLTGIQTVDILEDCKIIGNQIIRDLFG
jgi:hypothetical protein